MHGGQAGGDLAQHADDGRLVQSGCGLDPGLQRFALDVALDQEVELAFAARIEQAGEVRVLHSCGRARPADEPPQVLLAPRRRRGVENLDGDPHVQQQMPPQVNRAGCAVAERSLEPAAAQFRARETGGVPGGRFLPKSAGQRRLGRMLGAPRSAVGPFGQQYLDALAQVGRVEGLEQAFGPERTQTRQQLFRAPRRNQDQDRDALRACRASERGAKSGRISAGQCRVEQDQIGGHLAKGARRFGKRPRGDHFISVRIQRRSPGRDGLRMIVRDENPLRRHGGAPFLISGAGTETARRSSGPL